MRRPERCGACTPSTARPFRIGRGNGDPSGQRQGPSGIPKRPGHRSCAKTRVGSWGIGAKDNRRNTHTDDLATRGDTTEVAVAGSRSALRAVTRTTAWGYDGPKAGWTKAERTEGERTETKRMGARAF